MCILKLLIILCYCMAIIGTCKVVILYSVFDTTSVMHADIPPSAILSDRSCMCAGILHVLCQGHMCGKYSTVILC